MRGAGRHSAAPASAGPPPDPAADDAVWVPPPFEPPRPGDFVDFHAGGGFQVRRSHRGLVALLVVVLLAAAGGTWWYLRHRDSSSTQAITCQSLFAALPSDVQHYLHVTDGGTLPAGVPVPPGAPGQRCTAANAAGSGLIVVWPGTSQAQYATLLDAGGWSTTRSADGYTLFANGGDRRQVLLTTVNSRLIAVYDR